MKIVFDLDDTMCKTDYYSEKYILDFFEKNNLPYKKVKDISRYADGKFDWNEVEAKKWFKTYGDKMMLEFPPMDKAKQTIDYLKEKGFTISVVTARADDWHADPVSVSINWLKNNNIKFDEIYFGREDKHLVCQEINADIFVDDDINITANVANVFSGQKDKAVFLMNSNYNQTVKEGNGVIRVNDFSQLLTKLKDMGFIV